MQRNQQGFTLIELVIVIVILGILSAFALPRFADLGGDARAASIEGAAGAMRSASSIVRSACLASSECDTSADSDEVTLEGQPISLAFGYPIADTGDAPSGGILDAAQITADDYDINSTDGPPNEVEVAATGTGGPCNVTYTEAENATGSPIFAVDTGSC